MTISRRNALKGLSLGAGGMLLSPILHQIQAQAAGVASAPQRFIFVMEGNGLPWEQITPATIERGKFQTGTGGNNMGSHGRNKFVDLDLANHELPESLKPIAAYKQSLTVLNGLSGRAAGGGHSSDFGSLGCYNCGSGVGFSGSPTAETIDVALAKKLGGIFPHVGLGMIGNNTQAIIYNCSASGRGKPMPTTVKPTMAYSNLFGSIAGGAAKAEFQAQTNMLDFLRSDIKRLHGQVASAERAKLDSHLEAYEAMRNRQSRLNEIENTLRAKAPVVNDKYKSEVETDRLDAMFDIGAAAMIGGLTNVLTLASGVGNPYFGITFTGLGVDIGKHSIGHGQSTSGFTNVELKVMIRKFHFELIARLMKKFEAVPEGNGTMLDNTTVIYLSDAAEAHHSRCWEWPFVLIPGKNSGLKRGRYIEYPGWGADGHREIGNLYTTFLRAAGEHRDYFGVHDTMLTGRATSNGPLPELLA